MALDEPMTKRQARFLRVKTKQYDVVRNIMQRENSPHKNIAVYVRDIRGCLLEYERDLRSANETLNLLDQLRRDDDHEDMTLDEYVSTLFCKIKSIDSVVEQGRKAYDLERENAALKDEIAALRREVGSPSELDRMMEGSRPLRERYEDAPERGLCNDCRPLILAELWCQDHPEECEEEV
jgi:ASC-1-like (ASCH) protein